MNNNSVPSLFSKLPARPAQINDMVSKKKQIFARNLKKLEEKDRLKSYHGTRNNTSMHYRNVNFFLKSTL